MAKGRTAIDSFGGGAVAGPAGHGFEVAVAFVSAAADPQRINPDRLGDVLELRAAEIADREVEPRLDLAIGILGQADGAGRRDALQTRGDVDAVAHQVAVAFLDHVAQMDADPEFDAAVLRHAGIALDHAVLHLNGAAHGVHHTAELDQRSIPCALDHAPVVHGDGRIDQVAAQCPQPRQSTIFIRAGEPAVPDHVCSQDGG